MDIFQFALFPKFEENLRFLAHSLALKETWEYSNPEKELQEGNNSARYSLPILRNYLEYTFQRLKAEKKICYTEDKQFACFNTGLVTPNFEEIFALFEENKSYNKVSPYFFKAFLKESDREFLYYFSSNVPESANYFEHPELLIFNPKYTLKPDFNHIIYESKFRFPDPLKDASDREVRKHLVGAFDEITKKVKINYKLAIPQFYDGKIQLLLPLNLISNDEADLALVIDKVNNNTYLAGACLTTGMAYNNARLIVSPQHEWLKP